MVDFYHYKTINFKGVDSKITIASGPVIINDQGKCLLHIASSVNKWQFIGGRLNDSCSLRENVVRLSKEDLGLDIILNEDIEPFVVTDYIERNGEKELLVLIHYLAKTKNKSNPIKGKWKWFSFNEIVEMEENNELSSSNIRLAFEYFNNLK